MESEKKKAVLIGDNEKAQYHPLKGVDSEISEILWDLAELEISDDRNMLCIDNLKNFELCILYVDCWNEPAVEEQIKGILKFVENGGKLLVIHNGISLQSSYEFAELIGARFVGHPPYTKLRVISREPRNSILEGIEDFEIEDEPYRFEFCGLKDSEIIMEYEHEGSTFPAGWMRKLGAGRMVYLMPGHNVNSFKNQAYRQLISRSADYLLRL